MLAITLTYSVIKSAILSIRLGHMRVINYPILSAVNQLSADIFDIYIHWCVCICID